MKKMKTKEPIDKSQIKKIAILLFISWGAISLILLKGSTVFDKEANEDLVDVAALSGKASEVVDGFEEVEDSEILPEENDKIDCLYSLEDEDTSEQIEAHVFFDGEKYRSIVNASSGRNYSIFDGENYYAWSEATKKGLKMSKACLGEIGDEEAETDSDNDLDFDSYQSAESLFNKKSKVSCVEANQVDFDIPEDVEFFDQCEMLKKQIELIKEQNRKDSESDLVDDSSGVVE